MSINFCFTMGIEVGVSDKRHGNLSFKYDDAEVVRVRRKEFLAEIGLCVERCVGMEVGHGNRIEIVDKLSSGRGMFKSDGLECDGLITSDFGLGLFVLTADCLPIVIADDKCRMVGLLHAGWKGLDGGIIVKMLELAKSWFGVKSDEIFVYIGPSVARESYIKHSPEQVSKAEWKPFLHSVNKSMFQVDLVGLAKYQLNSQGIKLNNIFESKVNTAEDENYFSNVRSKLIGESQGRFGTVVVGRTMFN